MADVPEEWPQWVAQTRAALPVWDAWCPDDGRLAYALHIAEQYAVGAASEAQMQQACTQAAAAAMMCARAGEAPPHTGPVHQAGQQAWRVGWAVLLLTQAVRYPSTYTYEWAMARHGVEYLRGAAPCP